MSAYVPDLLAIRSLDLPSEVVADVSDAERALTVLDGDGSHSRLLEVLARFLLRAEAIASSKIDGLQVNTRRLAEHEAKRGAGIDDHDATAAAVLGNVSAMRHAVERVATADTVGIDDLLHIHGELMRQSDRPEIGGMLRATRPSASRACGSAP